VNAELPYRFGRAERRGTVVGWRPGQAAAVAVGMVGLVVGVSAAGAIGPVAGVVTLALGVTVAVLPVHGRGLDEWLPVAVGFAVGPRRGALCDGATVESSRDESLAFVSWPNGEATCVAVLEHRGLRALDDDPRELCETVASWLRGLGVPGAPKWTVTLMSTTKPGPFARDAPWADPGVTTAALVAVTSDRPVSVAAALGTAGVRRARDLGEDELRELLDARLQPAAGALLGSDVRSRWRLLEGPASVHAAYVVEEWPSGDVDEQVLAPLCVSRDRRTITVAVRVEELGRARSRTARVRTSSAADRELAGSGGFLASPEATRDDARDAERAAELAAGHGGVRLVGAVAIDATDVLELEAAAARLLADAASCGVRLRRCDGDHRRGLLATVPGWCVP
jgi:hypothetical protein